MIRAAVLLAVVGLLATQVRADDILEALDQARKAYQAGDLANAKQAADLASQLIGRKNAEGFVTLLPKPLAGWTADEAQATAVGSTAFGASQARRNYTNANGDNVDVQITGDSAVIAQLAPIMANPQFAGAMGKIVRVGSQRAIQNPQGDIHIIVANKFLVVVSGSAPAAAKMSYAQAIDFAGLSKM
ncbi:MAG: hypothetical protein GEU91_07970 [Rhizobiales bacterium]|nr:hypothetical protein [Hyphomicrobiales bacterium]